MAGEGSIDSPLNTGGQRQINRNGQKPTVPIESVTKDVSYVATGTVVTQVLSISKTAANDSVKTSDPQRVEVTNTGDIPVIALFGYESYSGETADGTVHYLQSMILPDETVIPPLRGIIPTAALGQVYDGTAVDFTDVTNYVASGTALNDAAVEAGETEITVDAGGYFRVGDFIQLGTTASTTATQIEILEITGISTHALTVKRALFGTVDGDKDNQTTGHIDDVGVHFPFFNEYMGVYSTQSGTAALFSVPTTDGQGRFKARNLYGYGRTDSTATFGITAGSVMLLFYEAGYQNITNDGDITGSTLSGLTASTTYYMSISIDGGTTDKITFTTGSNLKFGGSDGVLRKIQDSIDALYYNAAKNGYKKKATIGIVDGNIRVTSGQNTAASAIAITTNTDGTSGTDELFDGTNTFGRFPADVPAAVAAKVPDSPLYDNVTFAESPNLKNIIHDRGDGSLMQGNKKVGTINYETGALDFTCDYPFSQFKVSVLHSGPFSGKRDADEAARANSLTAIHATVHNNRMTGSLKVEVF
tara:strand:- start:1082 stop:2677 length:1596 start_codon:yes stop_codon:yes gene_type:complete